MGKKFLRGETMSTAFVDEAAAWATKLTQAEARGPGDIENAWRRLESRYGVPWRVFWALRYRKPREIGISAYVRLQQAYRAERERQLRRLEHELAITTATARPSANLVAAVSAVVGEGNDTTG